MKQRAINDISFRYEESGNIPHYGVVPVEKMSTGIVYPYYGLVGVRYSRDSGYRSMNLYPMMSGNSGNMGNLDYTSTCLGGITNGIFKNLQRLADMNIHSLYYSNCVDRRWKSFAKSCQDVSKAIYNDATIGKAEPVVEVDTPLTMADITRARDAMDTVTARRVAPTDLQEAPPADPLAAVPF